MKPKLVAAVLVAGIFALGGGTAALAQHPSPARSLSGATAPVASARPASAKSVATSSSARSTVTSPPRRATSHPTPTLFPTPSTPSIVVVSTFTYIVKAGDTLSGIAEWFVQHGYGDQYRANEVTVARDLRTVVPGALISVSNGTFSVQLPD